MLIPDTAISGNLISDMPGNNDSGLLTYSETPDRILPESCEGTRAAAATSTETTIADITGTLLRFRKLFLSGAVSILILVRVFETNPSGAFSIVPGLRNYSRSLSSSISIIVIAALHFSFQPF
jgi:hypothetical protein